MKFPITREELQSFDSVKAHADIKEEAIQKSLARELENICNEFKASMRSNSIEKKFVLRRLNHIKQLAVYDLNGNISHVSLPLPRFIEKLKAIFIGCDIIIDPLQTYLIIDWS